MKENLLELLLSRDYSNVNLGLMILKNFDFSTDEERSELEFLAEIVDEKVEGIYLQKWFRKLPYKLEMTQFCIECKKKFKKMNTGALQYLDFESLKINFNFLGFSFQSFKSLAIKRLEMRSYFDVNELNHLTDLQYLDLDFCGLFSADLSKVNWKDFKNLTQVSLVYNQLKTLPDSFFEIPNLKELDITANNLELDERFRKFDKLSYCRAQMNANIKYKRFLGTNCDFLSDT